jgi:hypothetical protein
MQRSSCRVGLPSRGLFRHHNSMDLTLASVVMAFSQILPRDLAQLLRQLSDDDLLQLSLTTAQGPPTFRLLEFGLILRRERQRRLLLRVQQLERCLWLSRRRGRLLLLLKRCLPSWLHRILRPCPRRPMA